MFRCSFRTTGWALGGARVRPRRRLHVRRSRTVKRHLLVAPVRCAQRPRLQQSDPLTRKPPSRSKSPKSDLSIFLPEGDRISPSKTNSEILEWWSSTDEDSRLVDVRDVITDEEVLEKLRVSNVPTKLEFKEIKNYFEELDESVMADEDIDEFDPPLRNEKRPGRKRGVPLGKDNAAKIGKAMKGKNTYARSEDHKRKIAMSMRRSWKKRKESGKPARKNTVKCSVCGQLGHNRRTCPVLEAEGKLSKTVRLCSYCQKEGHTRQKCPDLKKDLEMLQKKKQTQRKKRDQGSKSGITIPSNVALDSVKEIEKIPVAVEKNLRGNVKERVKVPVKIEDIWKQALRASVRAWKDGLRRQRVELMLPMLKIGGSLEPEGWPGGIRQQFRVAVPLVETILKGLKAQDGLQGRLDASVLDDADAVAYWKSDNLAAILFPQPDSVDTLLALDTLDKSEAPSLMMMINPQWRPGQIVSDFGFGRLKKIRENFVNSFEDVFFMKRICVFSDMVLVFRCYPGDWEVHLIKNSGGMELIGTHHSQPDFERLLKMLKYTEGSMASMSWIDRLQLKYGQNWNGQDKPSAMRSGDGFYMEDLPPDAFIPSGKDLKTLKENAGVDVVQETRVLRDRIKNGEVVNETNGKNVANVENEAKAVGKVDFDLDALDIITGQPVRDLKMDPVREFRSLIGVFGGEEDEHKKPQSTSD